MYHPDWEAEQFDDVIPASVFVVGILHVISSAVLGFGALLLSYKAVSLGGIYDTWAPGGGDVRRVSHPTLRPSTILGHIVIALTLIVGGIWHICTTPWTWARRTFVWSGEAYLSYSLAASSPTDCQVTLMAFFGHLHAAGSRSPTSPSACYSCSATVLATSIALSNILTSIVGNVFGLDFTHLAHAGSGRYLRR